MASSLPGPSRASGGFVYFANEGDENNDFIPFDTAGPSTSRGPSTPTRNYPDHTFKSPSIPHYTPPNLGYTDYHSPNPPQFNPTHHSSPYGGNKRRYPSPNWQANKRGGNWQQNRGRGRQSGNRNFHNRSRGQWSGQTDNRGNRNANRSRRGRGNRNFPQPKIPIAKYFLPSMLENPWAKLEKALEEQLKLEEAQALAKSPEST